MHLFVEEELAGGRLLVEVETTLRARVHERGGDHGQRGINDIRLVNVEYEFGILDYVHPEAQRQAVRLPRVHNVRVGDAVQIRLFVEEIEQVFDGKRENVGAVRCAKHRLEEIVHIRLHTALINIIYD